MSALDTILQGAGLKPYRELIQHHVRKQTLQQLRDGMLGTVQLLPESVRAHAWQLIDAVNDAIAHDQWWWQNATVNHAFCIIIEKAIGTLDIGAWISVEQDAHKPENHELALNLFQTVTLNFAYSAFQSRKLRKLMGVRKGLLG